MKVWKSEGNWREQALSFHTVESGLSFLFSLLCVPHASWPELLGVSPVSASQPITGVERSQMQHRPLHCLMLLLFVCLCLCAFQGLNSGGEACRVASVPSPTVYYLSPLQNVISEGILLKIAGRSHTIQQGPHGHLLRGGERRGRERDRVPGDESEGEKESQAGPAFYKGTQQMHTGGAQIR